MNEGGFVLLAPNPKPEMRKQTKKPPFPEAFLTESWWAVQGSNLRPLPCEGNALPLS
jgi:hypothetical protein